MSTLTSARPSSATLGAETLADLMQELGDVPLGRVLRNPPPGMASEADLIRQNDLSSQLYELVSRTLVEKAVGQWESHLAVALLVELGIYLRSRLTGRLYGADAPFRMASGSVRLPDVSFISFLRWPGDTARHEAVSTIIPDLAVEILSEGNTTAEIEAKCAEYLESGVRLIWIADPRTQRVTVLHAEHGRKELTIDDDLDGADVLPGFRWPIRSWMELP